MKPRLQGRAFLIRFADDGALMFSQESDARRVKEVLPKRFGKYGLALHPEKTRLLDFRHPGRREEPKGPCGDGGSSGLIAVATVDMCPGNVSCGSCSGIRFRNPELFTVSIAKA